jgi:kynurenine formamidase
MKLIDLTKPLNHETAIYRDRDYSDPAFRMDEWCTVETQGFRVSRLALGTQTGTHIDAPAHFLDGGDTLETLGVERLIGRYFHVSAQELADEAMCGAALGRYGSETIVFLASNAAQVTLPQRAVSDLIALGCPVWAVACEIEIEQGPPFLFHRLLAKAGIYLIEDLELEAAGKVPRQGELIALPLRLEGVSGAPCRVVVRADDDA